MLSNPSKPPNFVMVFVDPPKRDASGNVVAPAKEGDAWTAFVNGGGLPERNYERRPDESLEQFKARVTEDFPVNGDSRYAIFGLHDKAPATGPEPTPTEA